MLPKSNISIVSRLKPIAALALQGILHFDDAIIGACNRNAAADVIPLIRGTGLVAGDQESLKNNN